MHVKTFSHIHIPTPMQDHPFSDRYCFFKKIGNLILFTMSVASQTLLHCIQKTKPFKHSNFHLQDESRLINYTVYMQITENINMILSHKNNTFIFFLMSQIG